MRLKEEFCRQIGQEDRVALHQTRFLVRDLAFRASNEL
jgi:hypothetical protein